MASGVAFIRWTDLYVVGVEVIDRQHEGLATLLNCLSESHRAGKSEEILLFRLDQLIDAVEEHFQAEEELMDEKGYPDAELHRAEHNDLAIQVNGYRTRFAAGEESLTGSILDFLRDWLRNHILISDRRLGRFLHGEALER
jgi:hemerythrin-like metal-binding protein